MKILSNPHTHTVYCDGMNTPEEMVLAALNKGFTSLGFSGHSYTPFDKGCSMSEGATQAYIHEVTALKQKYADQIEIQLGIEWDYHSKINPTQYDYTIGSVHYIKHEDTGTYFCVENTHQEMADCIRKLFDGDSLAMLRRYYSLLVEMTQKNKPNIIGHFDIVKKLNAGSLYFDENSDEYKKIALKAVEGIAKTGCICEVNTGGIYRHYTEMTYPSNFILARMAELGVPIILSTDAHNLDALDFCLEESASLVQSLGFTTVKILKNGGFEDLIL